MPNKRGHQILTVTSIVLSMPSFYALEPIDFLALELGQALTLLTAATPDLDINSRKFGGLGELIGFKTYAENVPHRAGMKKRHWTRMKLWHVFFFSHIPFVGTLIRTFMLINLLVLVGTLVPELAFNQHTGRFVFWLWAGMSISDTWHLAADFVTGHFNDARRKRYQQKMIREREERGKRKFRPLFETHRYKRPKPLDILRKEGYD